jgi:eukaryotic-like serine/threonine-protein kinase
MSCPRCGAGVPGERGPCGSCSPSPSLVDAAAGTLTVGSPAPSGDTSPVAGPLPPPVLGPGAAFGGRYTIVEEIGAGGMGRVYKAIDRRLGRTVALKLLSAAATHSEARQRFQRELVVAQSITHGNVCRVHDMGEVDEAAYISMEYVEGQTLDDLVRSVGLLSPKQTLSLGRQICAALEAIHERGVVHRDLKPSNIMVDRGGRAIVMDFGMAYQHGDDRLTGAGAVVGTLAYLSPEQARGSQAEPRSDVYSLGLMLYEMLTGRRPPGDGGALPLALRDSTENCPPPSRLTPEVPPALDALVMRCLERDPARRPSTARELGQHMAEVQSATAVSGLSASALQAVRSPRARRRTVAAVAAVAVAALIAAAAVWLTRGAPSSTGATSVAVLPLVYQGPPEHAYLRNVVPLLFSDRLRAAARLQVVPFASSRAFTGHEEPGVVAEQLGVGQVVQGRLTLPAGGGFELALALRRAREREPSWTRTVRAGTGSVLDQVERLQLELAAALGAPLDAAPPRDRSALDEYLRGRGLLEGWDVASNAREAEAAFRGALAADPDFAEAHALLALTLCTLYQQDKNPERVQEALHAAQKALALSPALPEAHAALGMVELARGRSAEAARAFQYGLELAPADDSLCRRIGRAYAALGRSREAERMYRRAIQLRPAFWINYNDAGAFFVRQGRLADAQSAFENVVSLHPEADTGFSNLAAVHILGGRHEQARPLLEAALRITPSAETHNNLGVVHYAGGRFLEASRAWQAAIDTGAQYPIVFSNLGDAYRQLGREPEAARAYTSAVERWRAQVTLADDLEARAALAMALAGQRRCGDARQEAAAAEGRRLSPTGAYYLAVAYAVCRQDEAATRLAVRAVEGGIVSDVRTNPDLRRLLDRAALRAAMAATAP